MKVLRSVSNRTPFLTPGTHKQSDVLGVELVKFGAYEGYLATLIDKLDRELKIERRLNRVSNIIELKSKPALVNWSAAQAVLVMSKMIRPNESYSETQIDRMLEKARTEWRTVRDEAADYGKLAHAWIERFLLEGAWPEDHEWVMLPVEVCNSLSLFAEWWKKHDFQCVESELYLFNADLGLGGTLDMLARDRNGDLWLIDWKTSKSIYETMLLQVSAYFGMCWRMPKPIEVKRMAIVRIGREDTAPQMEEIPRELILRGWAAFVNLCHAAPYFKETKKICDRWNKDHKVSAAASLAAEKAKREKAEAEQQKKLSKLNERAASLSGN